MYVLVQGRATLVEESPTPTGSRMSWRRRSCASWGAQAGRFWDRWLREYYADRVPVEVTVERVLVLPSDALSKPST